MGEGGVSKYRRTKGQEKATGAVHTGGVISGVGSVPTLPRRGGRQKEEKKKRTRDQSWS